MSTATRVLARLLAATVLTIASSAALTTTAPAAVRQADEPLPLTVELDQSEGTAGPGEELAFVSTVTNTGDEDVTDVVAHLNILTTDGDVYVDPEDWSPRRTQYVDVLAPGESVDLTWDVQAVTSGPLVLFVSVASGTSDQVESSGPYRLTVQGQRVVDATRVMPAVLWAPAGVLTLLGVTFLRRRRHR
jgi:uncharacterized membrane protein